MKKKNYEMILFDDKKSDCDILLNDVENVFGSIGQCFEAVLDDRKSKMQVAGSVLGILGATTKFLFHGTTCVAKNTPKAIVTIANAKRELTDTISNEYQEFQKEQREIALDTKIKMLKKGKK